MKECDDIFNSRDGATVLFIYIDLKSSRLVGKSTRSEQNDEDVVNLKYFRCSVMKTSIGNIARSLEAKHSLGIIE